MATSGEIYTSKYGPRGLYLKWHYESKDSSGEWLDQNPTTNSTTIHWELSAYGDKPGTYYVSSNFNIYVNGENIYYSNKKIDLYGSTVIASGTHTVYHDSDGSKSITIRVTGGVYAWSITNVTGEDSWALDTIPRAATIVSAPNFTDEDSPTVEYSNTAGNAASSLQLGILTPDLDTAIIYYREIPKTGTSYTFNFSEADRNKIRNYCMNAPSATVVFVIRTVIAGETYWRLAEREASIINANPVIQPVIVDVNPVSYNVTGDNRTLVSGVSTAQYTSYVSAAKGATITSISVECDGKIKNTENGQFENVINGTFTFRAVDSRGYETVKKVSVKTYPYEKPTISITSCVLQPDGNLVIGFAGRYYKGTYGSSQNRPRIQLQYSSGYNASSGWIDISSSYEDAQYPNTYTGTYTVSGLNYVLTYNVQLWFSDIFADEKTPVKQVSTIPLYAGGDRSFFIFAPYLLGPLPCFGAIPPAACIHAGDDFNNYVNPGTFGVETNDEAGRIKNCPSSYGGKLFINSSTGQVITGRSWNYIMQIYLPVGVGSQIYIRNASTGTEPGKWTWSPWRSITVS